MLVRGDELVTALRQRRRIKFRLELNFLSPACPTSTRNTPSLPHLYSNLVPHGPRPCVVSPYTAHSRCRLRSRSLSPSERIPQERLVGRGQHAFDCWPLRRISDDDKAARPGLLRAEEGYLKLLMKIAALG